MRPFLRRRAAVTCLSSSSLHPRRAGLRGSVDLEGPHDPLTDLESRVAVGIPKNIPFQADLHQVEIEMSLAVLVRHVQRSVDFEDNPAILAILSNGDQGIHDRLPTPVDLQRDLKEEEDAHALEFELETRMAEVPGLSPFQKDGPLPEPNTQGTLPDGTPTEGEEREDGHRLEDGVTGHVPEELTNPRHIEPAANLLQAGHGQRRIFLQRGLKVRSQRHVVLGSQAAALTKGALRTAGARARRTPI